ncbi:ornithine cyclodeaminase family protein [Jiangella asiatica]|uniref:ornithine cyclodeaminase family protein n=1 Tax=Jiangella asiatica TaxID=2530372 RepID=UPI0013A5C5BD|nr:ornithine cyclodeaminase family protein [Jiangella asiatica]
MSILPIYLSEADVADLLDARGAIDVLDRAFRATAAGETVNRPRTRIPLGQSTYNLMSAGWASEGVVGAKVYTVSAQGAPMHMFLHAADGSGLLAVLAAGRISGLRTGGVSGLSARYLANDGNGPIGVIGAGFQAAAQVRGIVAATGADRVNVFSPSSERREAFARQMSDELGIDVVPVGSPAEACSGARVIVTITNSPTPVLDAADVPPGSHLVAAGNNTWMNTEVPPELLGRAATVVVDDVDQARLECGELMRAADRGLISWDRVRTLADVVSGVVPGRTAADDITVFEWQGIALADLAVAHHLYKAAKDKGRGTPLE